MYHPAAALRGAEVERQSYEDVAKVPQVLLEVRARRAATALPPSSASASAPAGPPTSATEPDPVLAAALAPEPEPAADITIF